MPQLTLVRRARDRAFFAEVLGDALSRAKFLPHEYTEEVVPQVQGEYEQSLRDLNVYAFDLAHQLAFRKGLGNSLFASPHVAVDQHAAVAFAKSAFTPSNVAVLGSNIDAGKLASLVSDFVNLPAGGASSISTSASQYYGGEVRVPASARVERDQLVLAFKGAARSEVDYAVLALLLGGESSVKWGQGASPLSKLARGAASAKAFNLAYSDAGLFGISVSAPTNEVADIATKAVAELKQVAQGVSSDALKQAVNKAKFAAAAALETRVGQVQLVGEQLAVDGQAPSLESVFAKLDKVSVESLAKVRFRVLFSFLWSSHACTDLMMTNRLPRLPSQARRLPSRSVTRTLFLVRSDPIRSLLRNLQTANASTIRPQTPTLSDFKCAKYDRRRGRIDSVAVGRFQSRETKT